MCRRGTTDPRTLSDLGLRSAPSKECDRRALRIRSTVVSWIFQSVTITMSSERHSDHVHLSFEEGSIVNHVAPPARISAAPAKDREDSDPDVEP